MRPSFYTAVTLFGLATLFPGADAQQYAGSTIPNSLPTVTGSAISYFKINDASGVPTTLINYFSAPGGARQDPLNVQRALIVLSGANRDPWNYWKDLYVAMQNASKLYDSTITEKTVAIMAPYFANTADANTGYPYNTSAPAGQGSTTNALVWSGTDWSAGANNVYPANHTTISSYDTLDQAVTYFANPSVYPKMKQIIVAGHSMGAQMAQRYSVIGKQLGLKVPITYWSGNPDSFVWLNSSRPVAPSSCPAYDAWDFGLANYTYSYNAALLAAGPAAVRANLATKNVAYARGLNDHGDYPEGCGPYSQGADRGERFYSFHTYFPPNSLDTIDYYPNIGHNDAAMFGNQPGSYRLFVDNWNGNGSRAADFGPRQVAGDNPHPVAT